MTYYKYHLLIVSVCDINVLVSSEDSSENNLSSFIDVYILWLVQYMFQITKKNTLISECIIIRIYYISKVTLLRSNLI